VNTEAIVYSQETVRRKGFAREVAPARATTPAQPAMQAIRANSVRIANQELARWGNGSIKEADPRMRQVLQDYWATGTGNHFTQAQLGDPTFQKQHPWSAAFISWVMQQAGAGQIFRRSAGHAVYIHWAKENRLRNQPNPFKAYRVSEVAPRVGDLVCKSRAGSGATYDTIQPGMKTHCDIVIEVRPGQLVTVGGNVRNSVSQTKVHTDANGFIQDPAYFAVIRYEDGTLPRPSVSPPSLPTPSAPGGRPRSGAPRLIRKETQPPGTTLYINLDLGITDRLGGTAPTTTGIFIPDGYVPGAAADVILFLHGFKGQAHRRMAIDQYWNAQQFPFRALREGINDSRRNVLLVAPTLGARSEAGGLETSGGLDAFLTQVLAAVSTYGPPRQAGQPARLGQLILACHSGGGKPMRRIAGSRDQSASQIREAWGFDCTYNHGDDSFWSGWARTHPNGRVYIYYIANSQTAPLALSLRRQRVPNVVVSASRDKRHDYVPITYWRERLQGAGSLTPRGGGLPARPGPTVITMPPITIVGRPCETLDGFDFDRDQLKPAHQQALARLAQRIVTSQSTSQAIRAVDITGHTDPVGTDAYNVRLGQRRALQVRRALMQALDRVRPGTAARVQIRVQSRGEREPISSNNAQNRRVEICFATKTQRLPHPPALPRRPSRPSAPPTPAPRPTPRAPSGDIDVRSMTQPQFIEFVGQHARRAMATTGVPASVTVAQAILETGWGRHTIGGAKNLFGIKGRGPAGSVRAPTQELINGRRITVDANFAAYNSFEESITEHARFFQRNRRYAEALRHGKDADRFAREIQRAGYATAPNYADALIALMRRHNLYRFDR